MFDEIKNDVKERTEFVLAMAKEIIEDGKYIKVYNEREKRMSIFALSNIVNKICNRVILNRQIKGEEI